MSFTTSSERYKSGSGGGGLLSTTIRNLKLASDDN